MAGRRRRSRRSSARMVRSVRHGSVGRRMTSRQAAALRKAQLASARKRRRRRATVAVVAGSTVVAGAVLVHQTRDPVSFTRVAVGRRRLVARHVARARADHEHMALLRARIFAGAPLTGAPFDRRAAVREARRLTAGYRKTVRRIQRSR